MKSKSLWSCFVLLGLVALVLFTSCSSEKSEILKLPEQKIESFLSYEWATQQDNDTTWLICKQNVTFETDDGKRNVQAMASVKLWPEKEVVSLGAEENPKPQLAKVSTITEKNDTLPVIKTVAKDFIFNDGQTVKAIISNEIYSYMGAQLPYVDISDVSFKTADVKNASDANNFDIELLFVAKWSEKSSGTNENGEKDLSTAYQKISSNKTDKLLNTKYNSSYVWHGDSVILIVEKVETWSISGTKKQEFSSPALPFMMTAQKNKSLEVKNFDFTSSFSSIQSECEDLSVNSWTISKTTVTNVLKFDNGSEEFHDVFEYPLYTVQFALDGSTVDFDLSVDFRYACQTSVDGANSASILTNATAVILHIPFTKAVATTLVLVKEDPTPNPDPEPDPEPELDPSKPYGKIISFSVSAVFDVDEIHKSGNITKKCVIIRYEKGYEWGVCGFEENFPSVMNFVNSGYTGFNSVAKDTAQSSFQPARAEDKADGIYWYAENNKLLSGIDIITCKVYGWKNVVNGKYTYVINGYTADYSQDRYAMSLTAPDGSVMKFASSTLK